MNKERKTYCLIPMRLDGKRLPRKPLIMIGDKLLCERTWECTSKSGFPTYICCPEDDPKVWQTFMKSFATVIRTPFSKISNGTERIGWAIRHAKPFQNISQDDIVINVQGDNGWFNPSLLRSLDKWYRSQLDQGYLGIGTIGYPPLGVAMDDMPLSKINGPGILELLDRNIVKIYLPTAGEDRIDFRRTFLDDYPGDKILLHAGIYIMTVKELMWYIDKSPTRLEEKRSLEQMRWVEYGRGIKVMKINRTDAPLAVNVKKDIQILTERVKRRD